jgi:hypothetical protein
MVRPRQTNKRTHPHEPTTLGYSPRQPNLQFPHLCPYSYGPNAAAIGRFIKVARCIGAGLASNTRPDGARPGKRRMVCDETVAHFAGTLACRGRAGLPTPDPYPGSTVTRLRRPVRLRQRLQLFLARQQPRQPAHRFALPTAYPPALN